MTDPRGGRSAAPPAGAPPPDASSGRRPPLRTVGLAVVLAALVVLTAAVFLAREPGARDDRPAVATGAPVPLSALEGVWSGDGRVTDCAGQDDEDCSGTRSITLRISCSAELCDVTPFARDYGSPPLRIEEDRYRATGPVPPDAAPTCNGAPTRSALWRLELVAGGDRLGGTYAESTIQGFDCGATDLAWDLVLERA